MDIEDNLNDRPRPDDEEDDDDNVEAEPEPSGGNFRIDPPDPPDGGEPYTDP